MADEKGPQYWCRSWKAVENGMPPNPTIHVTGICTFPTGGYRVELVKAAASGGEAIALDVVVHRPTGPVSQAFTDLKVEFKDAVHTRHKIVVITHATADPTTSTVNVPVEHVE